MQIDGVFSGGGIKAYAYIGALQEIHQHNLTFKRVAGTSAGSIIASFLAAGHTPSEIEKLTNQLDLKAFMDAPVITKYIPGTKWFFLYFQMGLYHGRRFEEWLQNKLADKNVYTFGDLPKDALKVIISDLSLGRLIVIPDDLERVYGIQPKYFPVAKAVRMSSGFPYFFMPKKMPGKEKQKSVIVDGGLLSNFPMWVFENKKSKNSRPILGVKLSESMDNPHPQKIRNALDMLHALFSTMKKAHDTRYISKHDINNIIFIPVDNISATDFNLSQNEKEKLIDLGRERTKQFLKYWPK
ncbi:patatin-like phospholipase family protein [Virgibacillus sp. MSJ-26]|uniref:patatin-like phospholipase family protein n=1 Tax=Virgibacillus sp. MSJ-26 TaxID=2841522 RepID=UPI001C0FB7E7|nr:patatin-like phospholipase family protein [Virgibacillus sp. MSJ-26]MBU5466375.1 patatin-like phospholipase family protein [Virgibacillus sp. MSJ-26]